MVVGIKGRAIIWLLTALFFAYDFYLWGGLAITPSVGKPLRDMASLQSPLAATYLFVGRQAIDAAGLQDRAMAFAAQRFPDLVKGDDGDPLLIVPHFLSAQSAGGTIFYYGAPVLLLLSLVLHVRREKQIRSFGGKR
jgi:hypothetical protein